MYLILLIIINFLDFFLINLKDFSFDNLKLLILIFSLSILLNFPSSYYGAILNGMQKMFLKNICEIFFALTLQIGILILTLNSFDILFISFFFLTNSFLKLCTYIFIINRTFNFDYILPSFSYEQLKKHKSYLKNMIKITFMAIIVRQYDKLLISLFLSVNNFITYTFVSNLLVKGGLLSNAISLAYYPKFSELVEKKDFNEINIIYKQVFEIVCIISLSVYITFFWLSKYIILFIFNQELYIEVQIPIIVLCFAFYLNDTLFLTHRICYAFNQLKLTYKYDLICFLILIPITYILIKNYGLIGGSVSVLIHYIIGHLYFLPIVSQNCLNLNLYEIYKPFIKTIFKFLLIFIPPIILIDVMKLVFYLEVLVFLFVIVFYFSVSFFTLDKTTKKSILKFYNEIRR